MVSAHFQSIKEDGIFASPIVKAGMTLTIASNLLFFCFVTRELHQSSSKIFNFLVVFKFDFLTDCCEGIYYKQLQNGFKRGR